MSQQSKSMVHGPRSKEHQDTAYEDPLATCAFPLHNGSLDNNIIAFADTSATATHMKSSNGMSSDNIIHSHNNISNNNNNITNNKDDSSNDNDYFCYHVTNVANKTIV